MGGNLRGMVWHRRWCHRGWHHCLRLLQLLLQSRDFRACLGQLKETRSHIKPQTSRPLRYLHTHLSRLYGSALLSLGRCRLKLQSELFRLSACSCKLPANRSFSIRNALIRIVPAVTITAIRLMHEGTGQQRVVLDCEELGSKGIDSRIRTVKLQQSRILSRVYTHKLRSKLMKVSINKLTKAA
jgi:hypothetical protein